MPPLGDDMLPLIGQLTEVGTVTLAPYTPQKDVMIGEVAHPYNDKYVFVSKALLGALSFTYTVAGSMPKGTTFSIAMGGGFRFAGKVTTQYGVREW